MANEMMIVGDLGANGVSFGGDEKSIVSMYHSSRSWPGGSLLWIGVLTASHSHPLTSYKVLRGSTVTSEKSSSNFGWNGGQNSNLLNSSPTTLSMAVHSHPSCYCCVLKDSSLMGHGEQLKCSLDCLGWLRR